MNDTTNLYREPSVFLTVWDDVVVALTSPRKYIKWAMQPFGRSVAYLCILLAVMALVATAYVNIVLAPQANQAATWVEQHLPRLTFTDGNLSIADGQTFLASDDDQYSVQVDASEKLADVGIDKFYRLGAFVAQDGILLRIDDSTEIVTYSDMHLVNASFDGKDVARWIRDGMRLSWFIVPILVFVYLFIGRMLMTVLITFLFVLFSGFRLNFEHVWSMAIYAQTPALVVSYILFIFGGVPFISTMVFVIYLSMAVSSYNRFMDMKAQLTS